VSFFDRLPFCVAVGWVVLGCGDRRVATFVTRLSGADDKVAVAVLSGGHE